MEDIKIWVLSGVLSIVGVAMVTLVKWFINQALQRLDEMVRDIKELTATITKQEERILVLQKDNAAANQRMNNHAERLRDIEQDVAVLKTKL